MIQRIQCGNGNCYIVEGENGSILVDTARKKYKKAILEQCKDKRVKCILLTHMHVDHCEDTKWLAEQLNVPILAHYADKELISDNLSQELQTETLPGRLVLALSMKAFEKDKIESFVPARYVKEGDSLEEYGVKAKVIELPGHTRGSIGVIVENEGIIVGDALMNLFYPTVSLLYHDKENMLQSARRVQNYGKEMIYFGHGKPVQNRQWVKSVNLKEEML